MATPGPFCKFNLATAPKGLDVRKPSPPAQVHMCFLLTSPFIEPAIGETIRRRRLTQTDAARRCGTDQPTLSKVLRGRMESVTIDRLTAWLTALGRIVEIHVLPCDAKARTGHLIAAP